MRLLISGLALREGGKNVRGRQKNLEGSRMVVGTFSINKSSPQSNSTSIYKKIIKKILKTKKDGATWSRHPKIFEIEKISFFSISKIFIFIGFPMKNIFWDREFSKFFISNFFIFIWFSMNIFEKNENFSISKIFKF